MNDLLRIAEIQKRADRGRGNPMDVDAQDKLFLLKQLSERDQKIAEQAAEIQRLMRERDVIYDSTEVMWAEMEDDHERK